MRPAGVTISRFPLRSATAAPAAGKPLRYSWAMPGARYQLDHVVSHGDVDLVGEFKGRAVLGLLERAAVEASAALGFDADWYTRNQCVWVVVRSWM